MDIPIFPNPETLIYVNNSTVGEASQDTEEERDMVGFGTEGTIGFYDLRTRKQDR
jgi:hypothetical protein